MRLALAFYKAPGRWEDALIRAVTASPYSHVELIRWPGYPPTAGDAVSASPRDGGVRRKTIGFAPGHWDFLPLGGWAPDDAFARALAERGAGYDWTGIALTFTLPLRRQSRTRWFCSELCGHALGLPAPHTLAPGDLFRWAGAMNAAYAAGARTGTSPP